MATKKVRRRKQKLQRHEYELVVTTEDGDEVPIEKPEAGTKDAAGGKGEKPIVDGRGRTVQKPTWRRTLRRGAIFVPLIVIVVFLLGGNKTTTEAKVLNALILAAVFLPFSHLMDILMYRMFTKRQAREGAPSGRQPPTGGKR